MVIVLTIVHVIVCLFLIVVVLLQSGKAADLAGAFGGMGSQTVFGPRGSATVLSKATTISAIVFMLTSLTLSIMATRGTGSGSSVLDEIAAPEEQQQTAPVAQPGQQVPITVTPEIGGQKGAPQTVTVPVQTDPNAPAPASNDTK